MKKVFFMAAMLLVSAFGFAQPKITTSGFSKLSVEYKRCVVIGSRCYFDFLLTNEKNMNMVPLGLGFSLDGGYLYDDEGNIYKYQYGLERLTLGTNSSEYGVIEKMPLGVPVKFRIEFNNIDEYATKFTLLHIPVNSDEYHTIGYIEVRDIPIVRRDQ